MNDIQVTTGGLAAELALTAGGFTTDLARVTYHTGARMRTLVRARASGRPGPRAQTGDYRRSVSQSNVLDGDVPVSLVFTNAPQGRRLEWGFNGVDAAGRRFRQPPYPHWRPAANEIQTLFEGECVKLVERAVARLNRRTQ